MDLIDLGLFSHWTHEIRDKLDLKGCMWSDQNFIECEENATYML